ncbi:TPA: hypothetical protein ACH3X1_001434 [Trebouxia sp. C0004]
MEEVFINQEADPYVLEVDGRLDLSALELQPASIVINSGNGLMVSSNHIFVEKGKFLKTMAFGGHPLELVVSFPYLDIILLKGPKGPAFRLPSQNLLPGLPVMMLGFPKASITDIKGLDSPVAAKGHINAIPISMEVALADYHGAMPASSGAPVLFDTCTIAGVYTGALFHMDDEYIKTDHYEITSVHAASWYAVAYAWLRSTEDLSEMHNTGMGTAYLSHCFVNVQDAPRSRIDKDEQDMWWPQAGFNAAAASHSPKRKASTTEWDQAVKGIEKMALRDPKLAASNVRVWTLQPSGSRFYKTADGNAEDLLLESKVNELSKDEWRELIAGIPADVKKEIGRLKSAGQAFSPQAARPDMPASRFAEFLQTQAGKQQMAADAGSVISLPLWVSLMGLSEYGRQLSVRRSYLQLKGRILQLQQASGPCGAKMMIISGTPGIGKSFCALYMASYGIAQGTRVIYEFHDQDEAASVRWYHSHPTVARASAFS